MKYLYSILIIPTLFLAHTVYAQSGKVQGTVKDANGEVLPGATILVEDSGMGTSSDASGNFEITLKPGQYQLTCTMVGFESINVNATVTEGQVTTVEFPLTESKNVLQQVEIIGRKERSYKNTSSFIGSKTELNSKDLPQSVSFVTKELISDQGQMRVGEVVKNMSGVNQFTFYDDITIRGFRINGQSNTQLINGLRTSTGFWKQPLANYLERVEVMKGPSSALFGNASPGGVLNRVTKKPLDFNRKSLDFSFGSFNTFRALADFTGPMNADRTLLYRLNIGYEDANSFRDLQFDKNLVIAPSVSFLPTDKTRLNFDIIYNQSNSRLDRGQAANNNDLYSTPITRSLSSANDYLNENTYNISASLNHYFTEKLSVTLAYLKTGYNEDLLEHRSANGYAVDGDSALIEDKVAMQVFQRKRRRYIDNVSMFFNYAATTGALEHKLLVGYDYSQDQVPAGGSQLTASGYRNAANTGFIATYNPKKKSNYLLDANGNPVPNAAHFNLADPIGSQLLKDVSKYFFTPRSFDPTFYELHGIYAQDLIKLGKFQALLGFRYEKYVDKENYLKPTEKKVRQEAFLPRVGLVYELLPQINLYGTYVEGYNPQTASSISNPNAGGPFDPLMSNMIEAGAKSEWFNKQLAVTVGVYRIIQKNTLYNASDANNPDLLRQVGEEKSQGIEFDIVGHILPHWSILTTYSHNKAVITESPVAEEIDRQKPNAPANTASIWTRYSIPHGQLAGLGFGLGSNFVDKRILSINANQTAPSYVLVDAALYYTVNKVRVQFNFNNIFDKTHWVGGYDYLRIFPGKPRNFLVTLGYTF
ncbi:TonB-dependent receptor [Ohtaekwangia koreensis]|uniref:Iron complex outermembrane recepter protein n=1 Tax=Ohtaekwangia koreensis TaxID=688867 RepID=A0A1T5MCW8_9BACT|nr:TonB-dependent receptor [Ohtaekwangia koreensis]SKC86005.1 iron complex outermembrane recepter protein [Ohtaekwangia koreensis]